MKRLLRRAVPMLFGLLVLAALIGARITFVDGFDRLRLAGFDQVQRSLPRDRSNAKVVVVDIDDASLARYGQWPWSRARIAELVGALQDLGAAAIGLDMVLAEPDRASPARAAGAIGKALGVAIDPADPRLPDYDRDLAQTVARGRVVAGFGLTAGANAVQPKLKAAFAAIGGDPAAALGRFAGAVANLPALEQAAAGQGSFTISAGRDEIIRRLPLLLNLNGEVVPSLALEALRVANDAETIRIRLEHQAGPAGPVTGLTLRLDDIDIPLAADGSLWLHHGAANPAMHVSAQTLLDPATRLDLIGKVSGAIILVGTSAVGLGDLKPTPLSAFVPGVDIHAGAIEQILARHFISRPAWASGAELIGAAIAAFGVVLLAGFAPMRLATVLAIALALVAIAAEWLAFRTSLVLIDASFAVIALVACFVVTAGLRYRRGERDAERLRSAFGHYLAPAVVDQLARDPDQLRLSGESRDMTFLFTDLEGFTAMTERLAPEQLVEVLNRYLDGLCALAVEHGGTVDKIVGDALHVMFNAPVTQADHAERAVRCALAIDAFGLAFAAREASAGSAFGVTRIGVNSGTAVVGNFGGARRFDYTAHGDTINTAARLEAANKALGLRLCVSKATAEAAPALSYLPIAILRLRGKAEGVEVFAPCPATDAAPSWQAAYKQAYDALAQGSETAAAVIAALAADHPDEPLLALHAKRIGAGERTVWISA